MCEIDIGDKLAIGMYAPRRGENEDEQPLYMYARYGDVCMVASSFKNIIIIIIYRRLKLFVRKIK